MNVEAHELALYAINNADLYRQQIQPIIANLAGKVASGKYDPELSVKLWAYATETAAKRYRSEFRMIGGFDVATRKLAAVELRDHYDSEVQEQGAARTRYKIVRMFQDDRPNRVIKRRLTLAQAQDHCRNPATRGPGWFDGFERDTVKRA